MLLQKDKESWGTMSDIFFYAGVIILNKNSDERFMAEIKI